MANDGYHEPIEELSDKTRVMHKAITYLMEGVSSCRLVQPARRCISE